MSHGHGGKRSKAGRPTGSRNKRTLEAEQNARKIVDDPVVQRLWLKQAKKGELPTALLQTLMYYAWGKPVEHVEHGMDDEKPLVVSIRRAR